MLKFVKKADICRIFFFNAAFSIFTFFFILRILCELWLGVWLICISSFFVVCSNWTSIPTSFECLFPIYHAISSEIMEKKWNPSWNSLEKKPNIILKRLKALLFSIQFLIMNASTDINCLEYSLQTENFFLPEKLYFATNDSKFLFNISGMFRYGISFKIENGLVPLKLYIQCLKISSVHYFFKYTSSFCL